MKSTLVLLLSSVVAVLVVVSAFVFLKPKEEVTLPLQVKEYLDFSCIHCKNFHPTSIELRNKYKDSEDVKFSYVSHPILGNDSEQAAFAAEAAKEQGKFNEYIDLLYENYEKRSDADYIAFATELKLDIEKFNADRESEEIQKRVLGQVEDNKKEGIKGTPTILINGKKAKSNDLNKLVETIEEKLEIAKKNK